MEYKQFYLNTLDDIKSMYCRDDHDIRELRDFNERINALEEFFNKVFELVEEQEKNAYRNF